MKAFLRSLAVLLVCMLSARRTVAQKSDDGYRFCVTPEAELKGRVKRLTHGLLLLPYTERSQILALYGVPETTTTNTAGMIVDSYACPESLVLRTYFTARDPERHDALQRADFLLPDIPEASSSACRFESPGPIISVDAMAEKVNRLTRLLARLVAEARPVEKHEEYRNGTLTRDYVENEHFGRPLGTEIWRKEGKIVTRGEYRDSGRWSGSFLEEARRTGQFRESVYENGVRLHSIIPEWETSGDPARWVDAFVRGSADTHELDNRAANANSNILRICQEPPFLTWAQSNTAHEAYRVITRPSFSPAVVFYAALSSEVQPPFLEWISTDGKAGYPDTLTKVDARDRRPLTRGEVEEIRRIINRSVFWKNVREYSAGACDGWSLFYEGLRDGLYTYRSYSNTDASASEALALKLFDLAFPSDTDTTLPRLPGAPYLWNVRFCFLDAIRLLEHTGEHALVDGVLTGPTEPTGADGSPTALERAVWRCLKRAGRLITAELAEGHMRGDFGALRWDDDGTRLLSPEGRPIRMTRKKTVTIWDQSSMYDFNVFCGDSNKLPTEVSIKLTPSTTAAAYRRTATPPTPSATARVVLQSLGLNLELATVIDWASEYKRSPDDHIEVILVVPPAGLEGTHSYTVTVNHTKREYSVSRSGGIGGGGSTCSRDFPDSW
jgi:hypothetical protein